MLLPSFALGRLFKKIFPLTSKLRLEWTKLFWEQPLPNFINTRTNKFVVQIAEAACCEEEPHIFPFTGNKSPHSTYS